MPTQPNNPHARTFRRFQCTHKTRNFIAPDHEQSGNAKGLLAAGRWFQAPHNIKQSQVRRKETRHISYEGPIRLIFPFLSAHLQTVHLEDHRPCSPTSLRLHPPFAIPAAWVPMALATCNPLTVRRPYGSCSLWPAVSMVVPAVLHSASRSSCNFGRICFPELGLARSRLKLQALKAVGS